jgi:hypothetical protein
MRLTPTEMDQPLPPLPDDDLPLNRRYFLL